MPPHQRMYDPKVLKEPEHKCTTYIKILLLLSNNHFVMIIVALLFSVMVVVAHFSKILFLPLLF